MPFERTAGHTAALYLAVGEALAALVTARASEAPVDGEALVVKQGLAERALLLRERIVGGKRHRRRTAERRLDRGQRIRRTCRGCVQPRSREQHEGRARADHAAGQKRRREQARRNRRAHRAHISLPAASSMRETSASTAPGSLTRVLGGMGAGNAFLS